MYVIEQVAIPRLPDLPHCDEANSLHYFVVLVLQVKGVTPPDQFSCRRKKRHIQLTQRTNPTPNYPGIITMKKNVILIFEYQLILAIVTSPVNIHTLTICIIFSWQVVQVNLPQK